MVLGELAQVILHAGRGGEPTPLEIQMRLGELKALVHAAERGELRGTAWKPVRRHPDLWELRLEWLDRTQVRLYFHEPTRRPGQTVVAHAHVKIVVRGDKAATTRQQNTSMDLAHRRLLRGAVGDWGLGVSQPIFPTTPQAADGSA